MAVYDQDWVRSYYDAYGEREWERWERSPVEQVKFAMHLRYLRKYLGAKDRILEIGAGAGRFTQELARITDYIVVADLSPVQLQLNRENAQRLGYASSIEQWIECDICDLQPHFANAAFDAVVCYGGPLSYVFNERERAISELLRVTRPGGWLFLSVMSLWGQNSRRHRLTSATCTARRSFGPSWRGQGRRSKSSRQAIVYRRRGPKAWRKYKKTRQPGSICWKWRLKPTAKRDAWIWART